MKALIVDIKGKYAAALTANGMVQRIPDNKYTVGDEVNLAEIIPIRPLAMTAILAGPPRDFPVSEKARSMKNWPAPEYSRNSPNSVNMKM